MLRIAQNLSLQQKMAPQLIQSLQLLQMSTLELELEIKQQLELNPLLEETMEQREEAEEPAEEVEALKEEEELPQESEEVDWDALLDDQFDTGSYNSERTEYDPNWEVDREPQENRITAIPPLVEQLHEQLALGDLSIELREIGDPSKYLLSPQDLCGLEHVPQLIEAGCRTCVVLDSQKVSVTHGLCQQ